MDNAPAGKKPAILVVDDTPENIDVLKETLKADYIVRPALNGETALRIATTGSPPALVLLDVMMPGMDGFEVLQRLRADPATSGIPVIFVTALADMEGEVKGLALGAVDYITKPFNPAIVRARVKTHLALRETRALLEKRNAALLQERELVENIITRMRASKHFDDKYLRYLISSVDRTNGDILLATFTPDGRQRVLVGDITGHGLPAAVAAPLLSYVFYSLARTESNVEVVFEAINTVMCRQFPINIFMVGCLLEISVDRREARLWNTGMPPCLLLAGNRLSRKFASQSLPFGITEQIDIPGEGYRFEMGEGEKLYVFSDGVTETDDPEGTLFGTERLETFLAERAAGDWELGELLARLEEFRGNGDFADDITFVEIAR